MIQVSKCIRYALLVVLLASPFHSQVNNPLTWIPANPPGGILSACTATTYGYITPTGSLVTCVGGFWTVVGGGAAGRGDFGNTFIALGDSITGASTTYSANTEALGMTWPNQVNVRSNQQIRYLYNAGIATQTCPTIAARNATDVVARNPAVASIMCGTNDVANGVSLAATQAAVTSIVTAWINAGIKPVICTIPPRSDNDAYITPIVKLNAWLRNYARQTGSTLVDFYSILVDPTNSHYRSGYSPDNIHPTNAIYTSMADFFIAKTANLFPTWSPFIAQDNASTLNMLTNSMFVNGSPVPTGWNTVGNNCTHSVVANTVPPGGNWFQMVCTNAGTDAFYFDVTTGWSAGDRLALTGRINTSGATAGALSYGVDVECITGSPYFISLPINNWVVDTSGTFYMEMTVEPSTTNTRPKVFVNSGTGTIQVSQISLVNLTVNGLL